VWLLPWLNCRYEIMRGSLSRSATRAAWQAATCGRPAPIAAADFPSQALADDRQQSCSPPLCVDR